jgi:thiol:disulfide interchange protein DsbD
MRFFKIAIPLLLVLFATNSLSAQITGSPVKWKYSSKHVKGNEYDIYISTNIRKGWYVYSQHNDPSGPVPTLFEFNKTPGVTFVGKVKESGSKLSGFDDVFKMDVTKYKKKVVFRQRIKVNNPAKPYKISGGFEFMTCNDQKCLPPDWVEFSITTKPYVPKQKSNPDKKVVKKNNNPKVTIPKPEPAKGKTTAVSDNGVAINAKNAPVVWDVEGIRVSKDEYDVTFSADIKDGWELYSRYTGGSKGPMPLTFEYDNRDERLDISKRVKTNSDNRVRNKDERYNMTLTRYKDKVSFTQRIKIEKGSRSLNGNLYYTASSDKENTSTIPQRVKFSITLPKKITPTAAMIAKAERERKKRAAEEATQEENSDDDEESITDIAITGDADDGNSTDVNAEEEASPNFTGTKFDYTYAKQDCSGEEAKSIQETDNLWVFLLGFGSGLLALLTPCIFPMIPITVSYFTKQSKSRAKGIGNALAYGLSIIAIYVSLGLIVTSIFGAEALNAMSTNWIFNLIFFAVFVAFALSFFGFYELTLPSSWSTWSDNAADNSGGLLGIFFMAFTLSLVSFSCTGPIIGTLLAETADGTGAELFGRIPVKPLLGMLGFSTALALPFTLFALFPSWLNSLPQSGGWMNAVKVTLGFLELALAMKFLSTADLVYNIGLLKIEAFLGVWILVFLGLAAYMFGLLKLPLDYEKPKVTRGRAITGIASLAIVGYLAYGLMTYTPLKALSGLAPPVTYNWFRNEANMEYPNCPNGIRCFKDYDEALAFAQDRDLPVMIDFTGHGCVNCRKMEETVWIEEDVKKILSEDYVLVSLYVDERKKLEKPYRNDAGKLIRTVGNKWAQFEIEHFNRNSQPYYVLISPDEKVLNKPRGYEDGDKEEFKKFLECGLERWESIK